MKILFLKMHPLLIILNWWQHGTKLETTLTLMATIGVIICITPGESYKGFRVINMNYNRYSSTPERYVSSEENNPQVSSPAKANVCTTSACEFAAQNILENMDDEVEPCDDFYNFVCGNFVENTVIPDDKDVISPFTSINDKVKEQLRRSIEKPIMPRDNKAAKLVKNLYNSCMDIQEIEEEGIDPLLLILRSLGGWPVLEGDNWDESIFDWVESVGRARDIGHSLGFFINFGIITDPDDPTRRIIAVDQASLGLSREYLIEGKNEKILDAYHKFMVDIAVLLGAPQEVAEGELAMSLEFEKDLARISLPKGKRRNATLLHNPMTVAEMSTKFPTIPWVQYFNRILEPITAIDEGEMINVVVPSFLSKFEKLMLSTPRRIQANYYMWRIVMDSTSFLNDAMRQREFEYITIIDGSIQRQERWRECTDIVAMSIPLSVGSLFVKTYFNKDAKKNAVEMVDDIRHEFTDILTRVDWMDEDTRSSALDKAASMSSHIAYPDELLDDNKLDNYYINLELNSGSFLQNMLDVSIFTIDYIASQLEKPINKTEWMRHGRSAVVNAYYAPTENSIQFPAALLQTPFFDNDRPKYMNYGAIGFIIGHEITHGFDDQGRQFDKNGSLVDWWASSTEEKYLAKSKCIIDQYNDYIVSEVGLKLNGVNTQGENIADNGGIKTAYLAYKKWVQENGEEPRLPRLNYSPEQLFWISAASTWCTKHRPESLKSSITTDSHSPPQFRILGPFSNMIDFAIDFNCAVGTRMNPIKKCSVW